MAHCHELIAIANVDDLSESSCAEAALRFVALSALTLSLFLFPCFETPAWAQSVSGVRGFDGSVAPLFNLVGPGNLYLDNQGTQGYLYTPGQNFESYSFRNPTTGQAWSGAVMTLGPQLSIGLIRVPTKLALRSCCLARHDKRPRYRRFSRPSSTKFHSHTRGLGRSACGESKG